MILPGPEAIQLAIYMGWLQHRTIGGLMAGLLFMLPGILVMMALSILYANYQDIPLVSALFLGLKSAVLAIILEALWRMGKKATPTRERLLMTAGSFAGLFFFNIPFPLIIGAAVLIGFMRTPVRITFSRPNQGFLKTLLLGASIWIAPTVLCFVLYGPNAIFSQIAFFFSRLALVSFGGAYAALGYVAQQAVHTHHWLSVSDMINGLGLAETTPGPLILVVQYVGFLAAYHSEGTTFAGIIGALLTLWATFTPCFLWIFLGAPYVEKLRGHENLSSILSMITAAVIGVILNLALWFAIHTLFAEVQTFSTSFFSVPYPILFSLNLRAFFLFLCAFVLIFWSRLGILWTLLICSLLSMFLS